MKIERKTLAAGIVLIAAVPLVMLWQSSNTSKGTSPGISKYNVYQCINLINIHLGNGEPAALGMLCDFALGREGRYVYTETWIDHFSQRYGLSADVHAARGRLCAFRGDTEGMHLEFFAARDAARPGEEAERIERIIGNSPR